MSNEENIPAYYLTKHQIRALLFSFFLFLIFLLKQCNMLAYFVCDLTRQNDEPSDTKATRWTKGSIIVTVYHKPTNTDKYLDFDSHHHVHHKCTITWTVLC